jgi:hypothetical protein
LIPVGIGSKERFCIDVVHNEVPVVLHDGAGGTFTIGFSGPDSTIYERLVRIVDVQNEIAIERLEGQLKGPIEGPQLLAWKQHVDAIVIWVAGDWVKPVGHLTSPGGVAARLAAPTTLRGVGCGVFFEHLGYSWKIWITIHRP